MFWIAVLITKKFIENFKDQRSMSLILATVHTGEIAAIKKNINSATHATRIIYTPIIKFVKRKPMKIVHFGDSRTVEAQPLLKPHQRLSQLDPA